MANTRGDRLRIAREKKYKSALGRQGHRHAGFDLWCPRWAESPGGRDYGPDEAKRYARRFGVTPEWLLTGREPMRPGDPNEPPHRRYGCSAMSAARDAPLRGSG